MTLFQLLLIFHILFAMIWIGGVIVGTLIGATLYKSGDEIGLARFCRAFAQVAGPAFGGSGGIVLLTGIWMVAMDGYPDFSEPWVSAGFALWFVATILGAAVAGKNWHLTGLALNEDGATFESTRALIKKSFTWTWINVAVLIAALVVMVWRPS